MLLSLTFIFIIKYALSVLIRRHVSGGIKDNVMRCHFIMIITVFRMTKNFTKYTIIGSYFSIAIPRKERKANSRFYLCV